MEAANKNININGVKFSGNTANYTEFEGNAEQLARVYQQAFAGDVDAPDGPLIDVSQNVAVKVDEDMAMRRRRRTRRVNRNKSSNRKNRLARNRKSRVNK